MKATYVLYMYGSGMTSHRTGFFTRHACGCGRREERNLNVGILLRDDLGKVRRNSLSDRHVGISILSSLWQSLRIR